MLDNLPEKSGEAFAAALSCLIGSGIIQKTPLPTNDSKPQMLHMDETFCDSTEKSNPLLYCANPGSVRQPTVFITADELIERIARSRNEAHAAHATSEAVAAELKACKTSQGHPLLADNPHYEADSGSIRYMLTAQICHILQPKSLLAPEPLRMEIAAAEQELRLQYSPHAITGTKANTLVIYNDAAVMHARGYPASKETQVGRHIVAFDAHPEMALDEHEPPSHMGFATHPTWCKLVSTSPATAERHL